MKAPAKPNDVTKTDSDPVAMLREFMSRPFRSFAEIARERHAYWKRREAEAEGEAAKPGTKRAA
jgi:hypothetical protein